MSDDARLGFFAAACFFGGWWAFFNGFKQLRLKRRIQNVPTSKIRSLAMGNVELKGKAKTRFQMQCPISEVNCVYYEFKIEEERGSGKNRRWQTLYREDSRSFEFWVEDETGSVMVDPEKADFILEGKRSFSGSNIPAGTYSVLEKNNISAGGFLGLGRRLRVEEAFITPNAGVFLLGTALNTSDRWSFDRKERLKTLMQQIKDSPERMKLIDQNKDGNIDSQEWDKARAAMEKLVIEESRREQGDVVVSKYKSEDFVISDKDEARLLTYYTWRSTAQIILGPAAVVLGFFLAICFFN